MISRQRMETRTGEVIQASLGRGGTENGLIEALRAFAPGKKAVVVPSGRAGLYYLFRALDRHVAILPAYTCRVVVEAARLAGMETRFADIDLKTYNVLPEHVAALATPDSLIVATHQFGIPCDIHRLMDIARQSGAMMIEDCAGALGSRIGGVLVGSFGSAAVFSFEATKVLTAGRGGLVVFNEFEPYQQFSNVLGENARSKTTWKLLARVVFDPFFTSPMIFPLVHWIHSQCNGATTDDGQPDLSWGLDGQPKMARWQLGLATRVAARLEAVIRRRRELAQRYLGELRGVSGIELPAFPENAQPALIRFPIRVTGMPKLDFYRRCLRCGLDLAFSFSYACEPNRDVSPNAHIAANEVLDLPIYSRLTDRQVDCVIHAVRVAAGSATPRRSRWRSAIAIVGKIGHSAGADKQELWPGPSCWGERNSV